MKHTGTKDVATRAVAIALMLAGAVSLVAGPTGIGFPLVAIGIALTVVAETARHGPQRPAR